VECKCAQKVVEKPDSSHVVRKMKFLLKSYIATCQLVLEINLLMWIISGHDLMGHYFDVSTLNHTWKHSFYGIPGHKQT
jgi:hypothetical protein